MDEIERRLSDALAAEADAVTPAANAWSRRHAPGRPRRTVMPWLAAAAAVIVIAGGTTIVLNSSHSSSTAAGSANRIVVLSTTVADSTDVGSPAIAAGSGPGHATATSTSTATATATATATSSATGSAGGSATSTVSTSSSAGTSSVAAALPSSGTSSRTSSSSVTGTPTVSPSTAESVGGTTIPTACAKSTQLSTGISDVGADGNTVEFDLSSDAKTLCFFSGSAWSTMPARSGPIRFLSTISTSAGPSAYGAVADSSLSIAWSSPASGGAAVTTVTGADHLTYFLTPSGAGTLTIKDSSGTVLVQTVVGDKPVTTGTTRATANR